MIEGVRTFDQIKSLIKFFVFRKTGEKKTKKIVFHVIFNQYLDLIFDFFFEDIFDDFVFVLKMFIKSWTDHISSVGDHLNCNLFKRHLHNKFFERECQQIFCQFFFHFCHLFKSFLQWKYYTIKKRM